MTKEYNVFQRFKDVMIENGGIILIPHSSSVEFINHCLSLKIAITGIDRFKVDGNNEPLEVADFSDYENDDWEVYIDELAKSSKAFIDNFNDEEDIYYEFVICDSHQ